MFRTVMICSLAMTSLVATRLAAQDQPLKVYILAGQSNMQGHAQIRTFPALALDPQTAPILELMQDDHGSPTVCEHVWISALGSADGDENEKFGPLTAGFGAPAREAKIGPEFTFGIYTQRYRDQPILIIKTAWGGKSLHTDFRPPSAGPFEFHPSQLAAMEQQGKDLDAVKAEKERETGRYYRLMMAHIKHVTADIKRVDPDYDPAQGYELAGFVWFQGWNDMVDSGVYPQRDQPGGYNQYSECLAHFIRDVRRELNAPDLPFVIGVMGVGGPTDLYPENRRREKIIHQNFRDAMAAPAALPEFRGNVVAVLTENFWDLEVVALREREVQIKPSVDELREQMKSGAIAREDGETAIDTLYRELFTPRELIVLRDSVSNADYHYMGSAKILAQIGKAFADALMELRTSGSAQPFK